VLAARWQRPASRSSDDLDITAPDSPGVLQILEQVCQAVGFAHARGVVHRDLKPANVMVGPFGEVQVMDWGLALDTKARQPDDLDPVPNAATGPDKVIVVHRSMFVAEGTPAYMAPEQARGGAVDARADVFALGGVLCAILTGRPPFTGRDADDVLRRARVADLSDAFDRLDRSDADPELIALAKACLDADPDERPPDAGVVTGILIAHRTGWEEKLREFDREQAAAVARSGEARKTAWAAARAEYEAAARGRMWRAVVALAVLSSALAAGLALTHMAPEAPSRGTGCSP
jgi:serine/threonine protein kinase